MNTTNPLPVAEEIRPGDSAWNLATRKDTEYMLHYLKGVRWGLIEIYKDGSCGTFTENVLHCSDDCLSRKPAKDLDEAIEQIRPFFAGDRA